MTEIPASMQAWVVREPGSLVRTALPVPTPGEGELLVRVEACGVCRTDLHILLGELPARRAAVVPGHEAVGTVAAAGRGAHASWVGQRAGVAWFRSCCGTCVYCERGQENLCGASAYTGWDQDGGFAEYLTVPQDFAYHLPKGRSAAELAPLLCAGIIGFRALRRSRVPDGGVLGIYGFGASAHLTTQLALAEGARVHVMTRSADARALALELGASSAGDASDAPPEPLDSAILFAPVGDLVLPAMAALDRGGTLAVAGIHLTDIPVLDYQRHLFHERTLTTVSGNTRKDGLEFLSLADRYAIRPRVKAYGFDQAPEALSDLQADRVNGVAVLDLGAGPARRDRLLARPRPAVRSPD